MTFPDKIKKSLFFDCSDNQVFIVEINVKTTNVQELERQC